MALIEQIEKVAPTNLGATFSALIKMTSTSTHQHY